MPPISSRISVSIAWAAWRGVYAAQETTPATTATTAATAPQCSRMNSEMAVKSTPTSVA